jgi:hypothetical protein
MFRNSLEFLYDRLWDQQLVATLEQPFNFTQDVNAEHARNHQKTGVRDYLQLNSPLS